MYFEWSVVKNEPHKAVTLTALNSSITHLFNHVRLSVVLTLDGLGQYKCYQSRVLDRCSLRCAFRFKPSNILFVRLQEMYQAAESLASGEFYFPEY